MAGSSAPQPNLPLRAWSPTTVVYNHFALILDKPSVRPSIRFTFVSSDTGLPPRRNITSWVVVAPVAEYSHETYVPPSGDLYLQYIIGLAASAVTINP